MIIYVYIHTTLQCNTVPYTTLHYITYIHVHVFIFTHVCHLTTKPTVQRTKPRQTKKWRQAKFEGKTKTLFISRIKLLQLSPNTNSSVSTISTDFYRLYTYDVQTHWSWSQHILESIDSSRVSNLARSSSGASISDETPHWAECGYVHGLFAMSLCPLL